MRQGQKVRTHSSLRRWLTPLVVAAAGSVGSLPAVAADETETGTLSLVFENDLFYDTDRQPCTSAPSTRITGTGRGCR